MIIYKNVFRNIFSCIIAGWSSISITDRVVTLSFDDIDVATSPCCSLI
ncbi:hypothetical protein EVA_10400 [gut metagenome]|uniref:Uncharacterized protein n=1 Tax=gut metagenome TaxID=749906 RepID=J9GHV0_9ZZZZ